MFSLHGLYWLHEFLKLYYLRQLMFRGLLCPQDKLIPLSLALFNLGNVLYYFDIVTFYNFLWICVSILYLFQYSHF